MFSNLNLILPASKHQSCKGQGWCWVHCSQACLASIDHQSMSSLHAIDMYVFGEQAHQPMLLTHSFFLPTFMYGQSPMSTSHPHWSPDSKSALPSLLLSGIWTFPFRVHLVWQTNTEQDKPTSISQRPWNQKQHTALNVWENIYLNFSSWLNVT